MKRAIFLCLLVIAFALPAHAGHGTLRETETQIFVEYYGDANDKQAEKTATAASAQPQQMQPPMVPPAEAVAQLVASEAGKGGAAGEAQQDETRRQRNEARAARRVQEQEARGQGQAGRTTLTARHAGSSQNEE